MTDEYLPNSEQNNEGNNNKDTDGDKLNEAREKITLFIRRNFPQIQMHGGTSDILDVNPDEGYVHIVLSGACSGCGISPMTVQAIQRRMTTEIDFVDDVVVDTGMDSLSDSTQPVQFAKDSNDDNTNINAPF